ncbi:hypothetical protein A9Q75_05170 [Colwellia psychrerythraea]|uniref:Uncharacterized protein n=1 Tax=Colwellia psychrerythraea TaxID=28229 RepID=A0A1Y5EIZ3_COLPS|nr:hypothetical protein A9Q75_05170 [Colwellia psychrerythraea]
MLTLEENELLSSRFNVFNDAEFKVIARALVELDKVIDDIEINDVIANIIDQMALSNSSELLAIYS